MRAPRDDYVDLCAGYVLGALSAEERERLDGRLESGDPLCEAALVEMHAGVLLLAATVPPVTPSPELEVRVMAAIDEIDAFASRPPAPTPAPAESVPPAPVPAEPEPPAPSVRDRVEEVRALRGDRSGSAAALWGFVLAAIAVVAALAGWSTSQTARSELQVAEARLAEVRSELTAARAQLEEEGRWARLTGAPDVRFVSMKPTLTAASPASARAFFDPSTGLAVVHLHDVPRVSDHSFEVWVIGDEGSTSIGLLDPDHAGYDVVRASLGVGLCVRSIAVSMEPEGGSPDPTGPSGPIVMLGRVGD